MHVAINQVWSIDSVSNSLNDSSKFRTPNVLDHYNLDDLGIEVGFSLLGERIMRTVNRIIEWRGKQAALRCHNGSEHIGRAMRDWSIKNQVTSLYIEPGNHTQNGYLEGFKRTVRHEWLDMHAFESIEHTQLIAPQWLSI